EELAAGLRALSRRQGTTLYMTLLAGWAVVLSRLSGQEDVVVGTPTANRRRSETEGLIGFFVNTLVHRVDLSGAPATGELLERVRRRALEAQQHQDIPFEQVVELVQPARSLAYTPLFQVMLAWQNAPRGELRLPGLERARTPGGTAHTTAKFDLSLFLWEAGGRIAGSMEYATALFDRATVGRYAGYLRRALQGMVADEDRPVERLEVLPEAERAQVVEGWNATVAEYPGDLCLHELFAAQAARTPDAVALVFGDGALSYGGLEGQANRLAQELRAHGVGPDVRVALYVERGPDLLVGMLGVLKAGGAYVPLDPTFPPARLRYVLEHSAPAVLLTHSALEGALGAPSLPVVRLDGDAAWRAARPPHAPPRGALAPEHLAYVMYTSGSTGRPKGVMNVHRGVVNLLVSMQRTLAVEPGDRLLALTTAAFDISVLELFLPLLCGARVELLERAAVADAARLAEAIAARGATLVQATPSGWRLLLDGGWGGRAGLRAPCGGEALPGELAVRLRERVG
ncbi:MAG TPA: AMP-binding protein, partial [Longimicrobiaceae bacterium]|nr:AMP-binding protein [Longimicrobiaceae bacterium]